MTRNDEFRQLIRGALGDMKQRELADRTEISLPYINQVLNGKIPSRDVLLKIVDALNLRDWRRARMFELGKYQDEPSIQGELEHATRPALPPLVEAVAVEMADLTPEQLDVIRRMVKRPGLLQEMSQFIDPRELLGPFAPSALCAAAR